MLNDLLQIKKVREGDIKTFEEIFRKYYSPLVFFSVSITRRMDVSEEILQDLFYVLWRDRANLQILRSLKAYLYSAVRNRSLQFCERKKLDNNYRESLESPDVEVDGMDPQQSMEYMELESVINKTMERMPERRQQIFRMHRFENKKYMEIADILSLSVKTVEAEISKALKTLRKEIEYHTSVL